MNPGMGLDTALVETGAALLKILLYLVLAAIVAGVLTLPLFYGVLAYKVGWFWSLDVTSGSRVRRIRAAIVKYGFPALSIVAMVLSLGYFGAFDVPERLLTGLPRAKAGRTQIAIKGEYDRVLRAYGEA